MRSVLRLSRFLLIFAVFIPGALFAQKKPKENAQVLVALEFAAFGAPTNALVYYQLYEVGQGNTLYDNVYGAGTGTPTVIRKSPLMTPNRHYQLIFSSGAWDYGEIKLSAPAGYAFYVDDVPSGTVRTPDYAGGSGAHTVLKLELRALDASGFLPAGEALPPRVGDLIWQIGTGRYSNGLSASPIEWRTADFTADLLNAASLKFNEPNSAEFFTVRHSDGGLLKVLSYQFQAYVQRNAGTHAGYAVEIRSPYASASGSGDGPYTFNQPAYRRYVVSNPDGNTWANRIQIEKQELSGGNVTRTETWLLSKQGGTWTVTQTGAGGRLIVLASATEAGTGNRIETVEVKDSAGTVATKTVRTYKNFGWGQEEQIKEVADPDSLALTTDYEYYETSNLSSYGRLKSVKNPDGSWTRFDYDDTFAGWGNLSAVYRPWQDGPTTPAAATLSNSQVTLFYSTPDYLYPANVLSNFAEMSAGTETKILGITTAKTTVSYSSVYGGLAPNYGNRLQSQTVQSYSAAGVAQTSYAVRYHPRYADEDHRGRTVSTTNPDGTKTSALYYRAYWWNYGDNNATNLHLNTGANNTPGEYRFNGFNSAVTGAVLVSSWDGQAIDPVYMVPNRSTVELTVYNDQGRVWYKVNYVFTGASGGVPVFEFLGMEETGYDKGTPSLTVRSTGYRDQKWFDGLGLSGVTGNDNSYVEFTRDALNRDVLARKWNSDAFGEYAAQGMIYTHKTFDIAGRVLSEKVSSSGDPAANPDDAVTATRVFNKAGLLTQQTDEAGALGLVTTFAYADGGRTQTVTLPGGATKITTLWLDGTPKSTTGTAVVGEYHQTTVNADGTLTAAVYALRPSDAANPTGSPRWSKITRDWLGRKTKEEQPSFNGGTFTKQFFYNATGHLIKTTEPGAAPNLLEYNDRQQSYRSGQDVNADGALTPGSMDRINETDTFYERDANGAWWLKSTTQIYNADNNATAFPLSIVKTRLNKFGGTLLQSETIAVDLFGNETRQTVEVNRGTANNASDPRLVTETTYPSDSTVPTVKVTRNGLAQKIQTKEGLVSRSYYDGRGRLIKQTNPRTDTSSTPRIGYAVHSDRIAWQQDSAGNQTTLGYQAATGRLAFETNPLGKSAYRDYNLRGQDTWTWGAATYPSQTEYDDFGQRVTLRTYRDPAVDWTQQTRPTNPGTGDVTTWAYEAATGLLLSKTDAANRAVTYTYTPRNQLATRTWARGLVTTYSYDPATSEQTAIAYSDSTPALSYVYNRQGQIKQVNDVTGVRLLDNHVSGKILGETLDSSYFGGRKLTYTLDGTTTGAKGRATGFSLSGVSATGTDYAITYGYDQYGRFNNVSSPSGVNATYAYATNANLIQSISYTDGWTETMAYDTNRDLLASINGQFGTVSKAAFGYQHDSLGRRTSVAESGAIFNRYGGSGIVNVWGYNDRSEVINSKTYFGTNPADTSNPIPGRDFSYAFDQIGSRTTSSADGRTTSYVNNALNQVTSRTSPASIDVTGLAPAAATVTVNGQATTRVGDYYYKNVAAASTPLWQSLAVQSSLGGSSTRYAYLAGTPENYTYDLDGNLTDDGRWHYTWDAENRLTSMETSLAAQAAGVPRQLLSFKYDHLGRRIRKTVANWNGSTYAASLDRKFIYNGWNLIAEHDALTGGTPAIARYAWGVDLSKTLQDGGGVGGLLAIFDVASGAAHFPAYDGNGNVHALVNRTTGSVTAAYEYSAFGETLRATGSFADKNPFRFSTKYADAETGLIEYGRRYYNPTLGRWLGRDPIEDKGGLHLYGFCGNNGINKWDVRGMQFGMVYNSRIVTTFSSSTGEVFQELQEWTEYQESQEEYELAVSHQFYSSGGVGGSPSGGLDFSGMNNSDFGAYDAAVGAGMAWAAASQAVGPAPAAPAVSSAKTAGGGADPLAFNFKTTQIDTTLLGSAQQPPVNYSLGATSGAAPDSSFLTGASLGLFGLLTSPSSSGVNFVQSPSTAGSALGRIGTGALGLADAGLLLLAFLVTPTTANAPAPAPEPSVLSVQLNFDALLSDRNSLILYHYTQPEFAAGIQRDGLWPGTYLTDNPMYTPTQAQQNLSLPNPTPPTIVFPVLIDFSRTPIFGPTIVQPISQPPRTGGGTEYTAPIGVPPVDIGTPFPAGNPFI